VIGRPYDRRELIAMAIVVLVPSLITAYVLLPELTISVPSNNDDATHFMLIKNASEVIARGGNVLDFWVPAVEMGMPWFLYYQPLPAILVAVLHRALFGAVDVLTVFNVVRYLLLITFPLTVWWSMRRLGASLPAACVAAACSTLLSGAFRYGFEYDSYTWRGFGLFTQLVAMHLSVLCVALLYRALHIGRGIVIASIVLGLLAMSHLIYAYMMGITAIVFALTAIQSRRQFWVPIARLGVVAVPALVMSAWMWLPFMTTRAYLGISPYLQREKYDSYGAPDILTWLVTGDLLDHGRLPVLTLLLGVGIAYVAVTRSRLAVTVIVGFALWLVLYFGRPTLGGVVDLLPLHEGLLLHRFIGEVDLFALILIGLGGGWVWEALHRYARVRQYTLAAPLLLILLLPAAGERVAFHQQGAVWMRQTLDAIATDEDARKVITFLGQAPGGRVFAGLRTGWGEALNFGLPFNSVRLPDLLLFEGFALVGPPKSSLTLSADLMWDIADDRLDQRQLLDVRYEVRPSGVAAPAFLQQALQTSRYTVYRVPLATSEAFAADTAFMAVPSQSALFALNRPWFNGAAPARRSFLAYEYPATRSATLYTRAGCDDGVVSADRTLSDRLESTVSCSSPTTLVLKVNYHPGWRVTIDGRPSTTYMVSPSFLAIDLPAGSHSVVATYESSPLKVPLALVAVATGAIMIWQRRRFEERLGSFLLIHATS
jgi:hypothetical protein